MDFDQAIAAHSAWKQKLSQYLNKPDSSLKPAEVALDNKCPLGQWIYGEGSRHSKMAEYSTLKTRHADFHRTAAEIVKQAGAGKSVSQDTALGPGSEFSKASSAVVIAIMAMKKHAAN